MKGDSADVVKLGAPPGTDHSLSSINLSPSGIGWNRRLEPFFVGSGVGGGP